MHYMLSEKLFLYQLCMKGVLRAYCEFVRFWKQLIPSTSALVYKFRQTQKYPLLVCGTSVLSCLQLCM